MWKVEPGPYQTFCYQFRTSITCKMQRFLLIIFIFIVSVCRGQNDSTLIRNCRVKTETVAHYQYDPEKQQQVLGYTIVTYYNKWGKRDSLFTFSAGGKINQTSYWTYNESGKETSYLSHDGVGYFLSNMSTTYYPDGSVNEKTVMKDSKTIACILKFYYSLQEAGPEINALADSFPWMRKRIKNGDSISIKIG